MLGTPQKVSRIARYLGCVGRSDLLRAALQALKTKVVAAFFSVLETKSATNEKYKKDMVNMIDQIISAQNRSHTLDIKYINCTSQTIVGNNL